MDDAHGRDALDLLADAFLTGPEDDDPASAKTESLTQSQASASDADADGDASNVNVELDPDDLCDPLAGPSPIRMNPKPAGLRLARASADTTAGKSSAPSQTPATSANEDQQQAATVSHVDADATATTDSHANTDATPHDPQIGEEPAAALVEAVMLANLPGVSGPWLTQYAQLLADQYGPAVILHVDDDLIDVEIVEPRDDATGGAVRAPTDKGNIDLVSLLDALVRDQANPVSVVLVHLEASAGMLSPIAARRLMAIDDWTVLTGSDDAAVVSAYRQIKQLVDADASAAEKHIGFMVLGSPEQPSRHAFDKLRQTCAEFVHVPVQLLGYQQKMVPVNVRQLVRVPMSSVTWESLSRYLQSLETPMLPEQVAVPEPALEPELTTVPDDDALEQPTQGASASQSQVNEVSPTKAAPTAEEPRSSTGAAAKDVPQSRMTRQAEPKATAGPPQRDRSTLQDRRNEQPPQAASSYSAARPGPASSAQQQSASPRPATASAPEPTSRKSRQHIENDTPDLVALLTEPRANGRPAVVPGALKLEASCPHQPGVRLLLDTAGVLHLLTHCACHDQPATGVNESSEQAATRAIDAAMLDLAEARQWVLAHLDLLAMTQRQCRFDRKADAALHLMTDRPDLAVGRATRLEGELHIHVLERIEIAGDVAWFSAPVL